MMKYALGKRRAGRPPYRLSLCGTPLMVLLVVVVSAGCQPATTGSPRQSATAAREAEAAVDRAAGDPASLPAAADVPSRAEGSAADEDWMACYINNQQVGHMHLASDRVAIDGQEYHRYRYREELKIKRFDDTTRVRTKLESLQKPGGVLRSFRSELLAGPSAMITEGVHQDGQLRMTIHTEGRTEEQTIPWQPDWRGFFADQQSLRDDPLKPGQTRTLKVLLPVVHQVATIQMRAVGYEATPLLAGSRQLLRIEVATELSTTRLRSLLWTDQQGRAWKSQDLQLNLVAYRVSREEALRPTSGEGFDLAADTFIRLDKPLPQPRRTREVVYRAVLTDGEIDTMFVHDGSQRVKLLDKQTAEVTVRAIRPGEPVPNGEFSPPTEADRSPGALIQSDDPLIVEMASSVAADQSDPWRLACELEKYVKGIVRLKNYSTALATAAEVARSREGDCTEHAMLLAALCRARGIPARVAVGLVYYPPAQGFAYHMWTEVWIEDRWLGLDATLADGGIAAAHVKLGISSMQGAHAYADLLPIVQAIGRLQLEVLDVTH